MIAQERLPLVMGALALVIALATPSWSGRLLDRGPSIYGHDRMNARDLDSYLRGIGAEQLRFDEGWNAAISVWRNGSMTWLKTNGKTDASSVPDMDTQTGLALYPAALHPAPKRAFVIGFGSGVSVHTIATVPGIERVDVAEIERAVLHAAPLFAEVNGNVLSDPKVHVVEDDARSALQMTRQPYDIIMSEPSNPWIAGVASLFTADYFRVAASRLAEGGIYAQWVQTYRVPASVVAVVVANLRAVFPHVEMWWTNSSDLILLASKQPLVLRQGRVAALLAPASPVRPLFHDWLLVDTPSRLLGRFMLGERGTEALARSAPFEHSDDQPALEFVAARGLISNTSGNPVFDSMMSVRARAGDTLPALEGWRLAKGEWQAAYAYELPEESPLRRTMAEAALAADSNNPEYRFVQGRYLFDRGNYRAALPLLESALRKLPDRPELLLELGIVLNSTELGAGRALLERVEALPGGDSAYAASVLAETAVAQGDWQAGAAAIMRALRGARPTLATPFSTQTEQVVKSFVAMGPILFAVPVLQVARETRPSWDIAYWGGAQVYARWGGEHCREAAELASELPKRFGWTTREAISLLRPCGRNR